MYHNNESITMFGYSIQFSQINDSSVWYFLHVNFWSMDFNLLFSFSLSPLQDCLPTIDSTHLKGLPDVGLKLSGWERVDTSLIPRTCLFLLITVIFNPFDWLHLVLIAGKTNSLPLVWYHYLAKWFLRSSDKSQG